MTEFKAAVGLSRKWDATQAGHEVAEDLIKQMDGKKPDFVLLYCTVHYKDYGGFKKLLKGVTSVLPSDTELIGGTIPGFIAPQGCFTRGVTAIGVQSDSMDIAVGIGKNTKRNPKKAVASCYSMIGERLSSSRYPHAFLYEIVSGAILPKIPGVPPMRVIPHSKIGRIMTMSSTVSTKLLQMGVGREAEIMDELKNKFNNYVILGVSSIDNNNLFSNNQFLGENVYTNSIVALGVKTDLNFELNTTHGLHKSDIQFNVTDTGTFNCAIRKIDGKPATKTFLNKIGWAEDYLDERIHRKTLFVPLGYEKEGKLAAAVMAFFYGDDIVCTRDIPLGEVSVYHTSGRELVESVEENLEKFKDREHCLSLIVSCTARLETLGAHVYDIWGKLKEFYGDTPFLHIFAGGEQAWAPDFGGGHHSESFNVVSFWR